MAIFDEVNAVPKPSHKRRTPKRKARGEFKQKTVDEILERDDHKCVKCRRSNMIESVPHHIIFKSQGGQGEKRNGATVCRHCHDWAHGKAKGPKGEPEKNGRKWFENWQKRKLDQDGDLLKKG